MEFGLAWAPLGIAVAAAFGGARAFSGRRAEWRPVGMLALGLLAGTLGRLASGADEGSEPIERALASGRYPWLREALLHAILPVVFFRAAFVLEPNCLSRLERGIGKFAFAALAGFAAAAAVVSLLGEAGWAPLLLAAAFVAGDAGALDDPLRNARIPRRMKSDVRSEALVAMLVGAAVFAAVRSGAVAGSPAGPSRGDAGGIVLYAAFALAGGLAIGAVAGLGAAAWMRRTPDDVFAAPAATVAAAWASFALAELLKVSGPAAAAAAALTLKAPGALDIGPDPFRLLVRFWDAASRVASLAALFALGYLASTPGVPFDSWVLVAGVLVFVAHVGVRGATATASLLLGSARDDESRAREAAWTAWAAPRGAATAAFVALVSQDPAIEGALGRALVGAAFWGTAAGLALQAAGARLVAVWLGIDRPTPAERLARLDERDQVLDEVVRRVDELTAVRGLRGVALSKLKGELEARRERLRGDMTQTGLQMASSEAETRLRGAWRQAMNVERKAYWTVHSQGMIGPGALQTLDYKAGLRLERLVRVDGRPFDPAEEEGEPPETRFLSWMRSAFARLDSLQRQRRELEFDVARGEALAAQGVLAALDDPHAIPPDCRAPIRQAYAERLLRASDRIEEMRLRWPAATEAIEARVARRVCSTLEKATRQELLGGGAEPDPAPTPLVADRPPDPLEVTTRLPSAFVLCREAPLFQCMEEADLARLAEDIEDATLAPGAALFREGDVGDAMYVVAQGTVTVAREGEDVVDLLDVLSRGDFIGEMALLTGEPRTATIRASTLTRLGRIPKASFDRLMREHPHLREQVWYAFARREFVNFLAARHAFRHLGAVDRRVWAEAGVLRSFEKGEVVPAREGSVVFVCAGRLRAGGEEFQAPALVERPADPNGLAATEAAHVLVLPSLLDIVLGRRH